MNFSYGNTLSRSQVSTRVSSLKSQMSFTETLLGLILCSFIPFINCGNGYVKIIDSNNFELLGGSQHYICNSGVKLTCKYSNDQVKGTEIQWVRYSSDGSARVLAQREIDGSFTGMTESLYLTVTLTGQYGCRYFGTPTSSRTTLNVDINIQNNLQTEGCRDPQLNSVTITPTSVTVSSTTVTTTPTSSSRTTHFVGLNPLIYTTITAILLVILTLVAIITCWLRSRKMSSQRTLLPQETPQDYLDYIREGQFTPLTTSELLASLHERPPTYLESQVIQQRMENEEEEEEERDQTPPPLPPRNNSNEQDRSHDTSYENLDPFSLPSDTSTLQNPLVNNFQPLPDPMAPLPDPIAPLLDPIVPLPDPSQYNDDWQEEHDENAPLINYT